MIWIQIFSYPWHKKLTRAGYCASKNDFSASYSFEEHGTSEGMAHSGLRSAEHSKNNKSFKNKIYYNFAKTS